MLAPRRGLLLLVLGLAFLFGGIKHGRQKFGGDLGCVSEPAYDERAPEAVAVALVEHAAGVHRIVRVNGVRIDVVMTTPSRVAYDAFVDAIRKPGADVWRLCCEMVSASVACALVDGAAMDTAALLDRWCGLGVVLVAVALLILIQPVINSVRDFNDNLPKLVEAQIGRAHV